MDPAHLALALALLPVTTVERPAYTGPVLRHLDLTGDGLAEQLRFDPRTGLSVALNLGHGRFALPGPALPGVPAGARPLASDLDGDGLTDLYLVCRGANRALLGDGQGGLREATAALGLDDRGDGLEALRLDLDGAAPAELLLHNTSGSVLFWGRPGGFVRDASTPERPVAGSHAAAAAADLGSSASSGAPPTAAAGAGTQRVGTGSGSGGAIGSGGSAPASSGHGLLIDTAVPQGSFPAPVPGLPVGLTSLLDARYLNADEDEVSGWTDVEDGTLTGADVLDGSLGAADLAAGSVGPIQLAPGAVNSQHVPSDALKGSSILDGTITAEELAAGSVGTSALAAAAVDSARLAQGAVLASHLAPGSVGATQLAAAAVDGTHIAGDAITGSHIANSSIFTVDIFNGTLSTADFADNAVTGPKIADGTITAVDLAPDALTGSQVADGSLSGADLAVGAVGSAQIADGTIASEDLGFWQVLNDKIAPGVVTFDKIAEGTIQGWNLGAGQVGGQHLAAGAVGSVHIAAGAVGPDQLAPGTITGAVIEQEVITSVHIEDGSLTGADVSTDTGVVSHGGSSFYVDASSNVMLENDSFWTPGVVLQQTTLTHAPVMEPVGILRHTEIANGDAFGLQFEELDGGSYQPLAGVAARLDEGSGFGEPLRGSIQLHAGDDTDLIPVLTGTWEGRVGIGTETPAHTLDVAGEVSASSAFLAGGDEDAPGYRFQNDADTGLYSGTPGRIAMACDGDTVVSVNDDGLGVHTVANGLHALRVTGGISCDTISKGAGTFQIDHPLDPENQWLRHSFVESPDMLNLYSGRVVLDAFGTASVELPEWFEPLNSDIHYQLTPIGAPALVYVSHELHEGQFAIAGGAPGMTVCWMLTGVRQDPFALANPVLVEEDKPERLRGTYRHPEAWGQPAERGEDAAWERRADERAGD